MTILPQDRQILRELAKEIAGISALPMHREKASLWRRLNQLKKVRPLAWITEIPWHGHKQKMSLCWTNWPMFTVGLVQRGFSDDDILKIIGGNALRVARAVMPA